MAAVNGHVDVLHTLIEYGANVNLPRDTGATPVYIAAERGHLDALKVIINANANVDSPRAYHSPRSPADAGTRPPAYGAYT